VFISNDWKSLTFSDEFKKELKAETKRWKRENHSSEVPNAIDREIKSKLMIKMQEESFDELIDGATVFEYDETKVHPVIEEEEYGGENIYFENGPQESEHIESCHIMTYGYESDDVGEDRGNYDAATDTYNNTVDYSAVDESAVREYQIAGSRGKADALVAELPVEEREIVKKLMNYSSTSLADVREMISLEPAQREVNLLLHASFSLSRDKRIQYSRELTVEDVKKLNRFRCCAEAIDPISKFTIRCIWDEISKNDFYKDFIGLRELQDAVLRTDDMTLLKYMPSLTKDFDQVHIKSIFDIVNNKLRIAERDSKTDRLLKLQDGLGEVNAEAIKKQCLCMITDTRQNEGLEDKQQDDIEER